MVGLAACPASAAQVAAPIPPVATGRPAATPVSPAAAGSVDVSANTVQINGRVWHDEDGDGRQGDGEPGVGRAPVVAVSIVGVFELSRGDARLRRAQDRAREALLGGSVSPSGDAGADDFGMDLAFDVTGDAGRYELAVDPGLTFVAVGLFAFGGPEEPQWTLTRPGAGSNLRSDSDFYPVEEDGPPLLGFAAPRFTEAGQRLQLDAGFQPLLAVTGGRIGPILRWGLVSVLAGVALLLIGRQWRRRLPG
ncbi:hypothetical protein GCM10010201_15500 [Pilimelia columellifera subsp. columellifera]|uniref:Uncharacterized protein n=1 Tax=Pilimelia columellifera subsp. columellifera TaxID=706583 RepID=A0ABP6ANJ8_9ACTN